MDMVYVTGDVPSEDTEYNIYSYGTTVDCRQQLSKPDHRCGVLRMVDDKLTLFGGRVSTTNAMHKQVTTYDKDALKQISYYPDMLCIRSKPGVITYKDHVIVMGGGYNDNDDNDSIEVMNYDEKQWKEVPAHLRIPMYNITPNISGNHITIVGQSDRTCQTPSYQIPIRGKRITNIYTSLEKLKPTTYI